MNAFASRRNGKIHLSCPSCPFLLSLTTHTLKTDYRDHQPKPITHLSTIAPSRLHSLATILAPIVFANHLSLEMLNLSARSNPLRLSMPPNKSLSDDWSPIEWSPIESAPKPAFQPLNFLEVIKAYNLIFCHKCKSA